MRRLSDRKEKLNFIGVPYYQQRLLVPCVLIISNLKQENKYLMRRKVIALSLMLTAMIGTKAQVGVNTSAPLGTFHIDPKQDTAGPLTTATNVSDDVIVSSDGYVGIGALPATSGNVKVTIGGTVKATVLDLNSDIRYKTAIEPLSETSKLKDLVPVRYYWNELGKNNGGDNKLQYGFIAQDIEKVYPDLVNTDSRGYKSVNYIQLIPILTEALQEQYKTIEAQRLQLEAVEARLKVLEAKLTQ